MAESANMCSNICGTREQGSLTNRSNCTDGLFLFVNLSVVLSMSVFKL